MLLLPSTSSTMQQITLFLSLLLSIRAQRRVIGDNSEQAISQLADIDVREERVYRRPATYLIIASKIVRPSSIYQASRILTAAYHH